MTLQRRSSLSKSIYQNMKLKETDELLEIWSDNDRLEWSDETFEVIRVILLERLGEVPPQAASGSIQHYKKVAKEKSKVPLPVILIFSPFLLVIILLFLQPGIDNKLFSVLMFSSLALFFFAPGMYFGWLGWIKGKETKQKILVNLRKNKKVRHSIFFRFHSLFLSDKYLPSYFLLNIRVISIVFIYGGVQMLLLLAKEL